MKLLFGLVLLAAVVMSAAALGLALSSGPPSDRQPEITALQQRVAALEHEHALFCKVMLSPELTAAQIHGIGC